VSAVRNWLADAGIAKDRVKLSQGMNWLSFMATVSEAEQLFKTEYFIFEHSTSGHPQIACHEYHLPQHISKMVDFVTPSIHFDAKVKTEKFRKRLRSPRPLRKREMSTPNAMEQLEVARPGTAANIGYEQGTLPKQGATLAQSELLDAEQLENCDQQITPNCIRALYGFGPGKSAQLQNTLGYV
jgi:tripeptidyl-peptidase-1